MKKQGNFDGRSPVYALPQVCELQDVYRQCGRLVTHANPAIEKQIKRFVKQRAPHDVGVPNS